MYDKVVTKGIIVGIRNIDYGDRILSVVTRELGLVQVYAKSVRPIRSKLRFHTQLFSHSDIELVQGKVGWRLVGASHQYHASLPRDIIPEYAHICRTILTHVHEAESRPELYDVMCNAYRMAIVYGKGDVSLIAEAQIMSILGYWPGEGTLPRWEPLAIKERKRISKTLHMLWPRVHE